MPECAACKKHSFRYLQPMQHARHEPTYPPGGYREILKVAYPLMISMGSFTLMQFVDRMFLAWHSSVSIQAAVPAGILSFTFVCGFMALAGYSNTFVAQFMGAGDPAGCSRATAQSVFVAVLSWPIMLALIPVGHLVLRYSGHAPAVLEEELIYFNILMIGSVASPLGAAVSGFYTGRSKTLTTMTATVISNLVNLMLDYALIFGNWGFPAMGIRGAAWASVIASFVLPAILLVLYFSPSTNRAYRTRATFRWDTALIWRLVRFGSSSGVHLALDVASFGIFVLLTGRMGEVALAASNIALSINMLTFLPMIGISIAAATVVGQYQGKRQSHHAETAAWTALKIGIVYMTVIGITYILFPTFYLSFFTDRTGDGLTLEQLYPVGRILMIIMALWGLVDAANLVLSGALKGAGDTRFVMLFSLALAWGLLVPGQLILVYVLDQGVVVAWTWTALYIFAMAIGFTWRFRKGTWKSIDVLGIERPIQPDRPGAEALVVMD